MKPAIRVENLSKSYRIGEMQMPGYGTLKEALTESAKAAWGRVRRLGRRDRRRAPAAEPFWALRDVSFEIKPGDVVGIIGRNGAGKSTLLKLLSRITEPTSGRIEMRGRMASLLEVGTGFHPELTGRENIYLNGAFLGMTREEISRKFDEIVAFSEIERFLDTPVKRYSSGMYVRLAFAVAAHLEQEIMVLDEVLAVGDAAFQKKCLGKMSEVAHQGRTVLFVSHHIAAIESLCQTGILLEHGRVVGTGRIDSVLGQYMRSLKTAVTGLAVPEDGASQPFAFQSVQMLRQGSERTETFQTGDAVTIQVAMELRQPQKGIYLGAGLVDELGRLLVSFHSMEAGLTIEDELAGNVQLEVEIPQLLLLPGSYHVRLIAVAAGGAWEKGHILGEMPSAMSFEVLPKDFSGHGHCFSQANHGAHLMPFRMRANCNGKQWVAEVLVGEE